MQEEAPYLGVSVLIIRDADLVYEGGYGQNLSWN